MKPRRRGGTPSTKNLTSKKIVDAGEATPTKNSGKEENPPEFGQASGQSLV
jgi:hypothetical protein